MTRKMKSALVAISIACLAATLLELAAAARLSSSHEWELYKKQHGKHYATPEEDAQRFALFLTARERIHKHNHGETQTSHKLGLNHLSDWTEEEFDKLNGLRYEPEAHANRLELAKNDSFLQSILDDPTPVPNEVDWRKVPNRVSAVKNQGHCGSCWAFATTGLLEGQQVVRNVGKLLKPLSEQDLVDCSQNDDGCEGGLPSRALDDIADMGGIESESDYPYVAPHDSQCKFNKRKVVMTDIGSVDLPSNDEEALKKVVAKFGPVATGIRADAYLQAYESGVFNHKFCGTELNHAVLIVGYGTSPKDGDFWIVKNSWSDQWGEKGYFRIKRGVSMCGISLLSTIPRFQV